MVELSNRQKKLLKHQSTFRDPATFNNQTAFRSAERRYKNRFDNPDYSACYDFKYLDKNLPHIREQIVELDLGCNIASLCEYFGSYKPEVTKAYVIGTIPGLIVIPNPFSNRAQRGLISACTRVYSKPPYVSNLDTHFTVPANGVWDVYERGHLMQITTDDPDYYIPLKLDPSKVNDTIKSGSGLKNIETSTATEGFKYNGLNDRNVLIKHSNLKLLPPDQIIRRLRWITFGYQYHWPSKEYICDENHKVPVEFSNLCDAVVKSVYQVCNPISGEYISNYNPCDFKSEGGVINYYQLKDSLMGHVDKSEPNTTAPLISFSLGQSAVFLIGGPTKDTEPIPLILRSGDILIMGEQCRRNYHGVPRIIENTLPEYLTSSKTNPSLEEDELNYWDVIADYLQTTRVNINVRQVF
ncbi:hypothetical protein CONCODRAFT_7959 [Conidiobolus coronatus NRRL 28638]|uniref:Fe2OG dioxygenase domain-containing protein n=1 Tax=Conidiobolus coronatus (strain ATCC 28846 / CBS 209.66 / NRRL 28638) TaxID=796925 RepID=A0A137P3E4_CONC2|nr:hypothetical protein CONCODRAFT_7959 [Conidiobolus coronatus NRRL 28638]|eukprot:KXN69550.1 hypothetical protein CONCODRAFT_7959 [Conidiobolus coronatus NRRL 28638]